MANENVKLCECGCGGIAPISKTSDATKGLMTNRPMRFIKGHNRKGVKPKLEPIRDKLNRLIERTATCWVWKGGRNRNGYGQITHNNTKWLAHRLMWVLSTGVQIDKGIVVRHNCDNPSCVNPSHLCLGSQADNVQDMSSRSRQNFFGRRDRKQSGEHNPAAKLTAAQVMDIRRRRRNGETLSALAIEFNISKSYVGNLAARRKWQNLEG